MFDVPIVIQLTDDEKFMFKDLTLEQCKAYAYDNAKDIIAFGFNPEKTFIFADSEYYGYMIDCVFRVQKCLNYNQCASVFGFDERYILAPSGIYDALFVFSLSLARSLFLPFSFPL